MFFTSQICTSNRSSPSKTWPSVKHPTLTRNAWMDGLKTRILSDFLRFRIQITRNAAKICKQLDLGISKTNKGLAFFSTALSYCQYTTGLAFPHDTLRRDGTSHKLHLTRCPRLWQGQTSNQRAIDCWSIFAAIKSNLLAEHKYNTFTVLEYLFGDATKFHVLIKRANWHF